MWYCTECDESVSVIFTTHRHRERYFMFKKPVSYSCATLVQPEIDPLVTHGGKRAAMVLVDVKMKSGYRKKSLLNNQNIS